MTKILLIVIAIFAVAAGTFFFLWRLSVSKHEKTKMSLENTKKQLNKAIQEMARLETQIKIANKNRKEADEKINALHNGNSVDNALNELSNNRRNK